MPKKDQEIDKPRPNPVRVPVRISAKSGSGKGKAPSDKPEEPPVPSAPPPPATAATAPVIPPPSAATAPVVPLAKDEKSEPPAAEAPATTPPPAPSPAPAPPSPRAPVVAPLRPPGSEKTTSSVPALEGSSSSGNRTPLLGSVPDGEPAVAPTPVNYLLQKPRPARHRKSRRFGALITLLMGTNLFILVAAGLWFYNEMLTEMDGRISDAGLRTAQSASLGLPSSHGPAAKSGVDLGVLEVRLKDTEKQLGELRQLEAETSQILHHLSKPEPVTPSPTLELREPKPDPVAPTANEVKKEITQTRQSVQDLQKRLEAIESQVKDTTFRVKDLIVAMSAASALKHPAAAALPESSIPGGVTINEQAVSAPLSPSESELILLKERNRLTSYADEAIATAERAPLTTLWEALSDPRLQHLIHGVEAEILRVRTFYLTGSHLTRYEIPVAELFPGSPAKRDTDLTDEQLLSLLNDPKQPWQTRMKTAWILGRKPKAPANVEALLRSVKEDQNLDVVKEATFSFQRLTGFETRLFEPTALMEAWWKEYGRPPGVETTARAIIPEPASAPAVEPAKNAAPAPPKNNDSPH